MDGIPWDREVELFRAHGRQADLGVTYTKMPLRDALLAFLDLSRNEQQAAGIGLNKPIRMAIDGREAMVGWYNAEACLKLAQMMPDQR
jgi:hypothetical protein